MDNKMSTKHNIQNEIKGKTFTTKWKVFSCKFPSWVCRKVELPTNNYALHSVLSCFRLFPSPHPATVFFCALDRRSQIATEKDVVQCLINDTFAGKIIITRKCYERKFKLFFLSLPLLLPDFSSLKSLECFHVPSPGNRELPSIKLAKFFGCS